MPIPLIIAAGAAVSLSLAVRHLNERRRLAKRLKNHNVAILGASRVGKSALLAALQKPAESNNLPATAGPLGGSFVMDVAGTELSFVVPRDLPGYSGLGGHAWKDAFQSADYVWYLFRSDLIAQGDAATIARVREDIGSMSDWMKASRTPKITLIGTWADGAPKWDLDPEEFAGRVMTAPPIDIGQVKLRQAKVIVGSLSTSRSSARLLRELRRTL